MPSPASSGNAVPNFSSRLLSKTSHQRARGTKNDCVDERPDMPNRILPACVHSLQICVLGLLGLPLLPFSFFCILGFFAPFVVQGLCQSDDLIGLRRLPSALLRVPFVNLPVGLVLLLLSMFSMTWNPNARIWWEVGSAFYFASPATISPERAASGASYRDHDSADDNAVKPAGRGTTVCGERHYTTVATSVRVPLCRDAGVLHM